MSKWKVSEEALKDEGIKTERLAVVFAGQDMFIGEVPGLDGTLVGKVVSMENPKRVVTLKMQTPQGIAFNTFIGPLELVEGGSLDVIPHAGFYLRDATDATKEQVFGSYAQHLLELKQNKAMQAGIHLPDRQGVQSGPTRLALR